MTRFQIEVPNGTTSKTDEIATLKKITEKFAGTGSYLADLFTQELFDWAEQQILVDFPPNVFDHWTADHDNAVKTIDRLRTEEGGWTKQIDQLEKSLEDHQGAIEDQKAVAIALSNESAERLEGIEILKAENAKLQAHNWELFQENNELKARNVELAEKIKELKVRLFDYMEDDGTGIIERATSTDEPELMDDETLNKIRDQSPEQHGDPNRGSFYTYNPES